MTVARRIAPYLPAVLALLALAPLYWPVPHLGDTFLFWYVGRLVVSGGSPYDEAAWAEAARRYPGEVVEGVAVNLIPNLAHLAGTGTIWSYPPHVAFLFAPFGSLPVAYGTFALQLAYVLSAVAAALVLARACRFRSPATEALALVLFATFQPLVLGIRGGQFGSFVLLGVALAWSAIGRGAAAPLAAGAVLAFAKPQTVFVAGATVPLALIRRRLWWPLAAAVLALGAATAAGLARFPDAPPMIAAAVGERYGALGSFATTWAFARSLGVADWSILGVLLALMAAALCGLAVRLAPLPLRPPTTLAASLVASLALSPHVQPYDQVVLVPAWFLALSIAENAPRATRVIHVTAIVVLAGVAPWLAILLQMLTGDQSASGLLTLLFAPLLVGSSIVARRVRA